MPRNLSRRTFLSSAAVVAGSSILPTELFASTLASPDDLAAAAPATMGDKVPSAARPFPLGQVRLGAQGPFVRAMEANRGMLHRLPVDSLLHSFRLTAGLPSTAKPLGGWEDPGCELRGHISGGHCLSASALLYASAGDEEIKRNAAQVVDGLWQCQKKLNENGYLGAYPSENYERLRNLQDVWAPFYTYHKIMAGLLEMYVHTGNTQALEVCEAMAGWVGHYLDPISDALFQQMMRTEFGGMGEVLANLYGVTGKQRYLELSHRFDHRLMLDPLANHQDKLTGFHANTNIPKMIAAARRYEVEGDSRQREIAHWFWHEVTGERCYCTGGTSNNEYWASEPGKLANELSGGTAECCCAYNMMKLTRHLFAWTPDARYIDYYERLLVNHRLGTIDPENGHAIYFLPLASGAWKVFGGDFNRMWCCTGTAYEEYAKLTDTIYYHDDDSLYVNLFIDSELDWREKGLRLRQSTTFPEQSTTVLSIQNAPDKPMKLRLRVPYWAEGGAVLLNGERLPYYSSPSSYLELTRQWRAGDTIELRMPMRLHADRMPDDESVQAVMYGPLVLAGKFGAAPEDHVVEQNHNEPKLDDGFKAPAIKADPAAEPSWVEPVAGRPLVFRLAGQKAEVELEPLYRVIHGRYGVYWKVDQKA
ncbi:MAG: beta-L-arabinofuranosidase domain-containing protein [Terracidiphilus sp.]